MSFSGRRYESYVASAPLFEIKLMQRLPMNFLPIIPNTGELCSFSGIYLHIAARKKHDFFMPDLVCQLFEQAFAPYWMLRADC
jgi:hypothetical protein